MLADLPPLPIVRIAVDLYLARAYDGSLPQVVKNRLEQFHAAGEQWHSCPALERDSADLPLRYALRLGNSFYPHMKLAIERSPQSFVFSFRVDTHDRHITLSPKDKEYAAFLELTRKNQALASAIENDWQAAAVPTFKAFLKQDLIRRASMPARMAG